MRGALFWRSPSPRSDIRDSPASKSASRTSPEVVPLLIWDNWIDEASAPFPKDRGEVDCEDHLDPLRSRRLLRRPLAKPPGADNLPRNPCEGRGRSGLPAPS